MKHQQQVANQIEAGWMCPGCGDDESDCECTKLVTCQTCAEQDTTNQCPGCNIRQCDDCVRFSPACCEMCYVVPN